MHVDPEPELDLAPSPPPVEQTLAERRARRAAILAKHANSTSNSNAGKSVQFFFLGGNSLTNLCRDACKYR
jgi:2-iminoacetate synthase ThiH